MGEPVATGEHIRQRPLTDIVAKDTVSRQGVVLLPQELPAEKKTQAMQTSMRALGMISRHFPQLVPTKPLLILPEKTDAEFGNYLGELRGVHLVGLNIDREDASPVLTLAHEFLHARFGELYKQDLARSIDQRFTDETIAKEASPYGIAEKVVRAEREQLQGASEDDALSWAVDEGFVMYHESEILRKEIEQLRHEPGQEGRVEALQSLLGEMDNATSLDTLPLIESDTSLSSQDKKRITVRKKMYNAGRRIIEGLVSAFPSTELSSVLGKIDLAACNKIKPDSPQFDQLIGNPRMLPGLAA